MHLPICRPFTFEVEEAQAALAVQYREVEAPQRLQPFASSSGPTKPLLTNPYFGFLQFLAFFYDFLGFVGAMAWPWPSQGPNKSKNIIKNIKNCKNPKYGLVSRH
jgi:hypothetical protein